MSEQPLEDSSRVLRFRCARCMRPLKVDRCRAGTIMRCPACYIDLVVPHESTIRPVDEAALYQIDDKPLDVREMTHRRGKASFPCPICRAVLAITSKDQLDREIVCPDCQSYVQVPTDLRAAFETPSEKPSNGDQAGRGAETSAPAVEVYGISGPDDVSTAFASAQNVRDPLAEKTFPVFCDLCHTLMRATRQMIGQSLECPDCGTKTLVARPPETEKAATDVDVSRFEGASVYGVQGAAKIPGPEDFDPNERLVPVVCSLCETRMYAPENRIGQTETCPDCGTKTLISDVPEREKILPVDVGNDYGVKEPEVAQRPPIRAGIDYRDIEGSLDRENKIVREEKERKAAEQAARKARDDKKKEENGPLVSDRKFREGACPDHAGTGKVGEDGNGDGEEDDIKIVETDEEPATYRVAGRFAVHEISTEFIVREPFLPSTVPGAKPDAYDLRQTSAPRLIPKPPPPPELFASAEEPLHVPTGPRPELVHGKGKSHSENRLAAGVVRQLRYRRGIRSRFKREMEGERRRATRYRHPPRSPFSTGVFRPFYGYGFREAFLATLAFGSIPAAALTYAGPDGFLLFSEGISGAGGEATLLYLCFSTIGFFCASYWIAIFCTYLFTLLEATLGGFDRIELPPDLSYIEGLSAVVKMLLAGLGAVLPGCLLWCVAHMVVLDAHGAELSFGNIFNPATEIAATGERAIPFVNMSLLLIAFCLVSHWIFYPIVLLAGIESTGSEFTPSSSNTLRSLSSLRTTWMKFYLATLPSTAVLAAFVYSFHFFGFYHETLFLNGLQFISILLPGSVAAVLYYRLLGRLAWVIESETRKRAAPNHE